MGRDVAAFPLPYFVRRRAEDASGNFISAALIGFCCRVALSLVKPLASGPIAGI